MVKWLYLYFGIFCQNGLMQKQLVMLRRKILQHFYNQLDYTIGKASCFSDQNSIRISVKIRVEIPCHLPTR